MFQKDFTFKKVPISEIVTAPDSKIDNLENDAGLFKSIEEALLLIKQNSDDRGHFKTQRSFSAIEHHQIQDTDTSSKKLLLEHAHKNSQSNKDLIKSEAAIDQSSIVKTAREHPLNESFGTSIDAKPFDYDKVQTNSFKNTDKSKQLDKVQYKIEFVSRRNLEESSDEEEESEDEEEEEQYYPNPHEHHHIDSQVISMSQESDDDDVVDNVIMKFTNLNSNKEEQFKTSHSSNRYKNLNANNSLEFTDENPFKESFDSLSKSAFHDPQQSGFNLPLQVMPKNDNKKKKYDQNLYQSMKEETNKIEFAICLYDFKPQKKDDLGFKAGERIIIEHRKNTNNWWYGRIGDRKGWFPQNYIKLKSTSS